MGIAVVHHAVKGKRIVLGVTGSIAAYKAVGFLRTLLQQGADVSVVMTESATKFVTPLTFEVLSQRQVYTELFADHGEMPHITVPQQADLFVIAPATANMIAKCARGIADDLLSTMVLTAECPLLIAPAMDGGMWEHPAVVENTRVLRERGVTILDPEEGLLASGQSGQGRFPSEDTILAAIDARLCPRRNWVGQRLLISAGPTREPIDAVRFISNGSSGKMGYAIAQAAVDRGAEVILVSGPTTLVPPDGVEVVSVGTAEEMYQALADRFSWSTVLIMTAAIVDFRPSRPSLEKVKKREWDGEPLELQRTRDVLETLSAQRTHQLLVGFAAESSSIVEHAKQKLEEKKLDLIVANSVASQDSAFGADTNEAILIARDGTMTNLARMSKRLLADHILDEVQSLRVPMSQKTQQKASGFQ